MGTMLGSFEKSKKKSGINGEGWNKGATAKFRLGSHIYSIQKKNKVV